MQWSQPITRCLPSSYSTGKAASMALNWIQACGSSMQEATHSIDCATTELSTADPNKENQAFNL
jgi:hypothetical protein